MAEYPLSLLEDGQMLWSWPFVRESLRWQIHQARVLDGHSAGERQKASATLLRKRYPCTSSAAEELTFLAVRYRHLLREAQRKMHFA